MSRQGLAWRGKWGPLARSAAPVKTVFCLPVSKSLKCPKTNACSSCANFVVGCVFFLEHRQRRVFKPRVRRRPVQGMPSAGKVPAGSGPCPVASPTDHLALLCTRLQHRCFVWKSRQRRGGELGRQGSSPPLAHTCLGPGALGTPPHGGAGASWACTPQAEHLGLRLRPTWGEDVQAPWEPAS